MLPDPPHLKYTKDDRAALGAVLREALAGRPRAQGISVDDHRTGNFDDAFMIERHGKGQGWTAHISIADAALLVRPGSAFDEQARLHNYKQARNEPVPHAMLPVSLVKDYLSLSCNSRRAAVTFSVRISEKGAIDGYDIRRTSFTALRNCTGAEVGEAYRAGVPAIRDWIALAETLAKARSAHAIDMVSRRHDGFMPASFIPPRRYGNDAAIGNFLVLEMMLLTNYVAGDYFRRNGLPYLADSYPARVSETQCDGDNNFKIRHAAQAARLAQRVADADISQRALITSPNRRYRDLVNMQILTAHLDGAPSPYTRNEVARIAANELHIRRQFKGAAHGLPADRDAMMAVILADENGRYRDMLAQLPQDEMLELVAAAQENGYENADLRTAVMDMLARPDVCARLLHLLLVENTAGGDYWHSMREAALERIESLPRLGWALLDHMAKAGTGWAVGWQREDLGQRIRMTMRVCVNNQWHEPYKVKTGEDVSAARDAGMLSFWRGWLRGALRPCEPGEIIPDIKLTPGNDNTRKPKKLMKNGKPKKQNSKIMRMRTDHVPGFAALREDLRRAGWREPQYAVSNISQSHNPLFVAALRVQAPDGAYVAELDAGGVCPEDALGRATFAIKQKLAQDHPRQFQSLSRSQGGKGFAALRL